MEEKIIVKFREKNISYKIIEDPLPHIVVESRKTLHGWWSGKRECTAERLLINPYNGCTHNCFMCYSYAFMWGYFQLYREKKIVTVCKNFDQVVAKQLESLSVVSCGYLSPVTDPFQLINKTYRLSEKIIEEFIKRNIPIEFVTKASISKEVIKLIKLQKHSFGQVSLFTLNQELHNLFCPNASSVDVLLNNLYLLAKEGIHNVLRIDPIIPYLTDQKKTLRELILRAKNIGVKHIIASCLDIPLPIRWQIFQFLSNFGWNIVYDYGKLYTEVIGGRLHAKISYRRKLFSFLREECDKQKISFALCMEFKNSKGKIIGLNKEFMSSVNCEGIDIPLYIKDGVKFRPIVSCNGACLNCKKPICGIKELALKKLNGKVRGFKISDYKRWGKEIQQPKLFLYRKKSSQI